MRRFGGRYPDEKWGMWDRGHALLLRETRGQRARYHPTAPTPSSSCKRHLYLVPLRMRPGVCQRSPHAVLVAKYHYGTREYRRVNLFVGMWNPETPGRSLAPAMSSRGLDLSGIATDGGVKRSKDQTDDSEGVDTASSHTHGRYLSCPHTGGLSSNNTIRASFDLLPGAS